MHDHQEGHEGGARLEAEGEVATARIALAGGDLEHAARHLEDALARDPALPETHEAMAEFAARVGGAEAALTYFAPEERAFIGTVAARGHLCAVAGHWDEAVGLLAQCAGHEPQRPWLDVAWLRRPDIAELVAPDTVARAAARVAPQLPDPVEEERRGPLLPLLDLVRASAARHPDHTMLLWCGSTLARRMGGSEEAVGWARRSYELEPSHPAAVMLGYALRSAGRPEEALEVWQREIARDPSDLDLYVDVAELLGSLGRPAEGVAWAERALAADPAHPKAGPAAHALRHAVQPDLRHLVALADHLRAEPGHGYAADLLARLSQGTPWLNWIPGGNEAVVSLLHQALGQSVPADAGLTLTVSALEPPSALLALRAAYPNAVTEIQSVPEPDLRTAPRPVEVALWAYEGTTARPAVRPPSPEAAEAVRRLAWHGWPHLVAAYDDAVALSGLDPEDLLGVLVHPPAPREDELGRALAAQAPDLWIRCVQVWACLGLAHHRSDEPWAVSRRRALLVDVLDNAEDWVCEAAALAIVATAWTDPAVRKDAAELVGRRLLDALEARRTRVVTLAWSLCHLALATPELIPQVAALATDVLRTIDAEDDGGAAETGEAAGRE
ncbi:tetratricopeptide repeat protein [Streptomyces sp. NPDC059718]